MQSTSCGFRTLPSRPQLSAPKTYGFPATILCTTTRTMYLVKVLTRPNCDRATDMHLKGCFFSVLLEITCSLIHRHVASFSIAENQLYCQSCDGTGVSNITGKYTTKYHNIVLDAWGLGKNTSEIQERLAELEMKEKAELDEWAVRCGRASRAQDGSFRLSEEYCFRCG